MTYGHDPHITDVLIIKNGQLIVEKQHLKVLNNVNNWSTVFIIYMFVYLKKFPGKAQEMIKCMYMHNIRLAASRQGHLGWSIYDEQFRLKKGAVSQIITGRRGVMAFEL